MARRGIKYNKDYVSYWNEKGEYGQERVKRMLARKLKRHNHNRGTCPECSNTRMNKEHFCPLDAEFGIEKICTCCFRCSEQCAMNI